MTNKAEYRINVNIHGHKTGQTVVIEVDKNGTPVDRLWRRRLKDAQIDGCISKVIQSKPKLAKEDK